jgi:hypothetical protein
MHRADLMTLCVCVVRVKRIGRASSVEHAVPEIDTESILDDLGITLADGANRLLANVSNEFLI